MDALLLLLFQIMAAIVVIGLSLFGILGVIIAIKIIIEVLKGRI